jgi:hypothetical protein
LAYLLFDPLKYFQVLKLSNILSQLFMELVKEGSSIHMPLCDMSALNDRHCTVIKSEGDQEAVTPTTDKVGFSGVPYAL